MSGKQQGTGALVRLLTFVRNEHSRLAVRTRTEVVFRLGVDSILQNFGLQEVLIDAIVFGQILFLENLPVNTVESAVYNRISLGYEPAESENKSDIKNVKYTK